MKQSLIFIIIVSLLVLTIQTVRPIVPLRTTTNKEKCPCGWMRGGDGRCSIRLPMMCTHTSRTTTNKEKCPCGWMRGRDGRCSIRLPMMCHNRNNK